MILVYTLRIFRQEPLILAETFLVFARRLSFSLRPSNFCASSLSFLLKPFVIFVLVARHFHLDLSIYLPVARHFRFADVVLAF